MLAGIKVGAGQAKRRRVEDQVEAGEGQGPFRNVRCHNGFGVVQQVEKLDSAARAQVQGPLHLAADGALGQGERRLANAQDVVLAQHAGTLVGAKVAGHPQIGVLPPARWPRASHRAAGRRLHAPWPGSCADSTNPKAARESASMPGSACFSSSGVTLWASSHSRTTTASGSVLVRNTRAAGTVWSRPSAWWASSPRSSATPSTV